MYLRLGLQATWLDPAHHPALLLRTGIYLVGSCAYWCGFLPAFLAWSMPTSVAESFSLSVCSEAMFWFVATYVAICFGYVHSTTGGSASWGAQTSTYIYIDLYTHAYLHIYIMCIYVQPSFVQFTLFLGRPNLAWLGSGWSVRAWPGLAEPC